MKIEPDQRAAPLVTHLRQVAGSLQAPGSSCVQGGHCPDRERPCLCSELSHRERRVSVVCCIHLSSLHPLVGLESDATATQRGWQLRWTLGLEPS